MRDFKLASLVLAVGSLSLGTACVVETAPTTPNSQTPSATATATTTAATTATPPAAASWTQVTPGSCAKQIAAGGGQVWLLGCNTTPQGQEVYKWNGSAWDKTDGGGSSIAVDSTGVPWVIGNDGKIWRRTNGTKWDSLPGCAKQIASGGGQTWALACSGSKGGQDVLSWNGKDWSKVDGNATAIAVGADGTAWSVGPDGKIWKRNGNAWGAVNGSAVAVAAGTPDKVFAINASHDIYQINSAGNDWAKVDGSATGMAVGSDGGLWAVGPDGKIWKK